MAMVPSSRPQQKREATEKILKRGGVDFSKYPVMLLGVRGYYLDSMGVKGKNDRGMYDDAIVLVAPEAYVTFNANTDPSVFRKRIASLKPGLWMYKIGTHGLSKPKHPSGTMNYTSSKYGYTALVQAAKVTVYRDNFGDDTGFFGINIHRGGNTTTSSEGCQTIHPNQWEGFISLLRSQLSKFGQKTVPYLLIENTPSTNK